MRNHQPLPLVSTTRNYQTLADLHVSTITKQVSGTLAESRLFRKPRVLWQSNQQDWSLPLTKPQKVRVGLYVILRDYADGLFPPRFVDQATTHDAERAFDLVLPGISEEQARVLGLTKPYWTARSLQQFLPNLARLAAEFEVLAIQPPQSILKLGCGKGWMAEALAQMGYRVLGTTLAETDVEHARLRVESLRSKGIPAELSFRACPMESVDEEVGDLGTFDAAFVYEALHHAHDWRRALTSVGNCLRPNGWLILANEPSVLHTFVSYRVARLSNTHEIGMSRHQIRKHLLSTGYSTVRSLPTRFALPLRPHWIAAQRGS